MTRPDGVTQIFPAQTITVNECDCSKRFLVRVGRTDEYRRAKRLFDAGTHPTFIGRSTVLRAARDGGLLFYTLSGMDVAVTVTNARNSTLLAMNVHPNHREHGLGDAIVQYLRPNFVRAIDFRVAWFERRGYVSVGEPKEGRKFKTQVMVRSELRELAGRVRRVMGDQCTCHENGVHDDST